MSTSINPQTADTTTSSNPPTPQDRTFIFRQPHPENPYIFTTHDPAIAHYLRHMTWKIREITCEPEKHPSVSSSSIIELPDNEIRIDEELLRGHQLAKDIREWLVEKGRFVDPDVRFVGAAAGSRSVGRVDGFLKKIWDTVDGKEES